MDDLIDRAWRLYREFEDSGFVVEPSVPVLFFGDLDAYRRSALKVLTVGLNPSRLEFPMKAPADDGFRRFTQARGIYPNILMGEGRAHYAEALSDYFRSDPYRTWFSSLEPVLNGMGSSFYFGAPNCALHTDLCSPLATDPTWNHLPASFRSRLETPGAALWHALVERLQPDLIVLSVAKPHLAKIRFSGIRSWKVIHTIDRKRDGGRRTRPYEVMIRPVTLQSGHRLLLLFGQGANTPFGSIRIEDRVVIGEIAKRYANAV